MRRLLPSLMLPLVLSCGPVAGDDDVTPTDAGSDLSPAQDAASDVVVTWDAPPVVQPVVYVHTGTDLFVAHLDTSPITLTRVGAFDCVGTGHTDRSMTDIAVNKDGKIFGVSNTAAYPMEVNGSTVHCTETWTLPATDSHFYGLTFAPAGVLAQDETMVAANSMGELWAIDASGQTVEVGTFGTVPHDDGHGHNYKSANVGKAWELSGDIVFLTNGENPVGFATLRDCPSPPLLDGCNTVDTLVEIDVRALHAGNTSSVTESIRGQVVKSSGCSDTANPDGYGSMYGIVALGDKVYGFSRTGNVVQISNVDGTACLLRAFTDDEFAGAGVTTLAPVIGPD
jgi:hypothetical protein